MPTNIQGRDCRELPWQAVHYLRKTVTYADVGIDTGLPFAKWLPAGASILRTTVKIKTAFNAATTNVLTAGQNASSYNDIVAAGDVDESVAESTMVLTGADLTISTDVMPYVKYTQSGTAATAGEAEITIEFTVDNDQ